MKLTPEEKQLICETSLERVLQNALWIAGKGLDSKNSKLSERCGTLIDDLEGQTDMLQLASRMWNEAREQIFKESLD